jgi:hypothetical protein
MKQGMLPLRQYLARALLFLTFAAGCNSPSGDASTCDMEPALVVQFLDASTKEAIATAAGTVRGPITVRLQAGQYPDGKWVVWGPPGMYEVYVQAPGYRDWEQHLIFVWEKACGGPRAVAVRAQLTPK